jgi:hypothetical protein
MKITSTMTRFNQTKFNICTYMHIFKLMYYINIIKDKNNVIVLAEVEEAFQKILI